MTDPLARLDNLSQQFDSSAVLQQITTEVAKGDVIGLLGLNGAGKTTLLETLLGFALPSGGQAQLFGEAASKLSSANKAKVGFVPQQDELLVQLTGQQNLALLAAFYPSWDNALVAQLASEWDIPLKKRVAQLSVGQRQKLSILAALAHRPALLILDEPVASLDPLARRRFLQTLIGQITDTHCTVIFSTHIVSDLERIADRIWILKDGQLRIDCHLDDLKESVFRLPAGADTHGLDVLHQHQDGSLTVRGQGQGQPLGLEDIFLELHA